VGLHDGASGFVSAVVHRGGIAVRYGDHTDKVLWRATRDSRV